MKAAVYYHPDFAEKGYFIPGIGLSLASMLCRI